MSTKESDIVVISMATAALHTLAAELNGRGGSDRVMFAAQKVDEQLDALVEVVCRLAEPAVSVKAKQQVAKVKAGLKKGAA